MSSFGGGEWQDLNQDACSQFIETFSTGKGRLPACIQGRKEGASRERGFPESDSLVGHFCYKGGQIGKTTFSVSWYSGNIFLLQKKKNFLEKLSSGTVFYVISLHETFINYTHTSTVDFYHSQPSFNSSSQVRIYLSSSSFPRLTITWLVCSFLFPSGPGW